MSKPNLVNPSNWEYYGGSSGMLTITVLYFVSWISACWHSDSLFNILTMLSQDLPVTGIKSTNIEWQFNCLTGNV